jgi:hypothetical protein
MLDTILKEFNAKDIEKTEAIKKLQNQKRSLRNGLTKKLISFFVANTDVQIDFEKLLDLTSKQKTTIFEKVAEVRAIKDEEISDDFLSLIEREEGKSNLIISIFEKADDKLKFRIASFCSGFSILGFQYDDIEKYLFENFNLINNYSKNPNSIVSDGKFDYNTKQFALKISTDKDNHEGLDDIVSTISKLIDNGFKNQKIEIFERTLCLYNSYYLYICDEDGNKVIPEIKTGSSRYDSEFVGKGGNFDEQLKSCLEYIVKNLYYTGGNEDDDE